MSKTKFCCPNVTDKEMLSIIEIPKHIGYNYEFPKLEVITLPI